MTRSSSGCSLQENEERIILTLCGVFYSEQSAGTVAPGIPLTICRQPPMAVVQRSALVEPSTAPQACSRRSAYIGGSPGVAKAAEQHRDARAHTSAPSTAGAGGVSVAGAAGVSGTAGSGVSGATGVSEATGVVFTSVPVVELSSESPKRLQADKAIESTITTNTTKRDIFSSSLKRVFSSPARIHRHEIPRYTSSTIMQTSKHPMPSAYTGTLVCPEAESKAFNLPYT